ncbi:hypothetical protein [Peijinzhouia sedimentorum]
MTIPFTAGTLSEYIQNREREIKEEIENLQYGDLTSELILELVANLVDKYLLDTPIIQFENEFALEPYKEKIYGNQFPPFSFNVKEQTIYPVEVIEFRIPVCGEINLLRLRKYLSKYSGLTRIITDKSSYLSFRIFNFYNDLDKVNEVYHKEKREINELSIPLIKEINDWNNELENFISTNIQIKYDHYNISKKKLKTLGIPIRKRENVHEVFKIVSPEIRKKIIIPRSESNELNYEFDTTIYNKILSYIFEIGKQLERYPRTYHDKDEEAIRDHILMFLNPNFEGAEATGETFNFKGKTDIFFQIKNEPGFIAECKIWRGVETMTNTLNQILSYLTWRNSKSVLILFVKNQSIFDVIERAEKSIALHNKFIRSIRISKDKGISKHLFQLESDPFGKTELTVFYFHFP